jgi:hypothetical protein
MDEGLACSTEAQAEALLKAIEDDGAKPETLDVYLEGLIVKPRNPSKASTFRHFLLKYWDPDSGIKSAFYQARGRGPPNGNDDDDDDDDDDDGDDDDDDDDGDDDDDDDDDDEARAKWQAGLQNHCDILYWCGRGGDGPR